MKKIACLLPLSLALGLCGCGPGYTFEPWTGPQSNWTTGPGGFTHSVDGVTLFAPGQFPPQPYFLVGSVSTDSEENVAKAVKDKQGSAALLSTESIHRTGSITWAAPGVVGTTPLTSKHITATIIKYR